MASKTTRIVILLCIDVAFFLLELIVGYAVHSLALVADAFHMLNDVLSLCVGLWAVRIATKGSTKMYTYGWQRAETLGALVNGVFLVALCLSIFLEAIQRFVEPQVVSNPKLVMIVGCFGLASNILGLFLFHDHDHSHGGSDEHDAEEGHSHSHTVDAETNLLVDEGGNLADVLPRAVVAGFNSKSGAETRSRAFTASDEDGTTAASGRTSETPTRRQTNASERHRRRASGSFSLHVHPASFRHEIIAASRLDEQTESEPEEEEEAIDEEGQLPSSPNETSSLMKHSNGSAKKHDHSYGSPKKLRSHDHSHELWHANHNHNKPKGEGAKRGGHSHGDLNMRGVFLHVMGDALGNIGVIASALFIWLTSYKWRYYVDPGVSLVITVIILTSAIPLCKAASRILLQAVPTDVNVEEIKEDLESLHGVISAHHVHVWQLSGTKYVASLHVRVDCELEGKGSAGYMHLAQQIRKCLHGYGIHSSTIQPEFCSASDDLSGATPVAESPKDCMLDCGDNCGDKNQCCPAPQ